jgi:DNA-binding transcriptional MerR regulator
MSGVTARTLRYYDEINLLPPAGLAGNGYRYYGRQELLRLQHILLMRELGVDLASIRAVVDEQRDPLDTLRTHHRRLLDERERVDRLAQTVTVTINHIEQGSDVPAESFFAAMTPERAKPTYKDHWQLPGGVAEADEAPDRSHRVARWRVGRLGLVRRRTSCGASAPFHAATDQCRERRTR